MGRYNSEIQFGKFESINHKSGNTNRRHTHRFGTNLIIQIEQIQIGKYKSEHTHRKTNNSGNTTRKIQIGKCNRRHCWGNRNRTIKARNSNQKIQINKIQTR